MTVPGWCKHEARLQRLVTGAAPEHDAGGLLIGAQGIPRAVAALLSEIISFRDSA